MSQADKKTLQAMYEYQRLIGPDKEEYVVRGAEVSCGYGEFSTVLNLPKAHGKFTADNRPLITCKDVRISNISGFGICKITKSKCVPSLKDWTHGNNEKIYDSNTLNNEYAVTILGQAECSQRPKESYLPIPAVFFQSSGQVVPDYTDSNVDAIEITESTRDDRLFNTWVRGDEDKDFIGKVHVKNSGVYLFGIYFSDTKDYYGGSVFLYRGKNTKSKKKNYLGAYKLCDESSKRMGIHHNNVSTKDNNDGTMTIITDPVYWTRWVEIVLYANEDYYVEVDCVNIDRMDYKLIGNEDKDYLHQNIPTYIEGKRIDAAHLDSISAVWFIDESFKRDYEEIFLTSSAESESLSKLIIILYLNKVYRWAFRDFLAKILEKQHEPTRDAIRSIGGNILSVLGFTPVAGPAFSIFALLIANLPDLFLRQLDDAINNVEDPIKIYIYDNAYGVLCGRVVDTYSFELLVEQEDINLNKIVEDTKNRAIVPIRGDKYSTGSFSLFPGFNISEIDTVMNEFEEQMQNVVNLK